MTDATKLADALVEAGIVEEIADGFYVVSDHPKQFICDAGPLRVYDEHLITDWRVAGACLKAWPTTINTEQLDMTLDEMLRDPAAICEAFTQALEREKSHG
jgi:hypothetical protein